MAHVRQAPPRDLKAPIALAKAAGKAGQRDLPLSSMQPSHGFPSTRSRVFLFLVALGSLRIVSTYRRIQSNQPTNQRTSPPGIEWLSKGVYHYETQHPPLARVATALGPYLSGLRSSDLPEHVEGGSAHPLSATATQTATLALARLGILPFFWVACSVVYLWGKRYLGEPATAFIGAVLYLPPARSRARRLATTDMALTAMVSASFLAIDDLARPAWCGSHPDSRRHYRVSRPIQVFLPALPSRFSGSCPDLVSDRRATLASAIAQELQKIHPATLRSLVRLAPCHLGGIPFLIRARSRLYR